jgi:hypothetical protein
MTMPNKTVEATAPRRCRLVRDAFYYAIVPVGAALPGAVPHLIRWAPPIRASGGALFLLQAGAWILEGSRAVERA